MGPAPKRRSASPTLLSTTNLRRPISVRLPAVSVAYTLRSCGESASFVVSSGNAQPTWEVFTRASFGGTSGRFRHHWARLATAQGTTPGLAAQDPSTSMSMFDVLLMSQLKPVESNAQPTISKDPVDELVVQRRVDVSDEGCPPAAAARHEIRRKRNSDLDWPRLRDVAGDDRDVVLARSDLGHAGRRRRWRSGSKSGGDPGSRRARRSRT